MLYLCGKVLQSKPFFNTLVTNRTMTLSNVRVGVTEIFFYALKTIYSRQKTKSRVYFMKWLFFSSIDWPNYKRGNKYNISLLQDICSRQSRSISCSG